MAPVGAGEQGPVVAGIRDPYAGTRHTAQSRGHPCPACRIVGEVVRLLERGHVDVRVLPERVVQRGRARLRGADHKEVRQHPETPDAGSDTGATPGSSQCDRSRPISPCSCSTSSRYRSLSRRPVSSRSTGNGPRLCRASKRSNPGSEPDRASRRKRRLRGARVTLRARTTGTNPGQRQGTRTDHEQLPRRSRQSSYRYTRICSRANNSNYTDR